MQACCALLRGMGQVLLIVRPRVHRESLPSGQSDASTSAARGRHVVLMVLQLSNTGNRKLMDEGNKSEGECAATLLCSCSTWLTLLHNYYILAYNSLQEA